MAEFYEVLKRAVGALPGNTGDARRAVYERARKALIVQLEGFSPPLTPSEITSQRLSLEEAIRKVEGEAARAALGLGRSTSPRPTPPPAPATRPPSQATTQPVAPSSVATAPGQSTVAAASSLRQTPEPADTPAPRPFTTPPASAPLAQPTPASGQPASVAPEPATIDVSAPKGPPFRATDIEKAPKLPGDSAQTGGVPGGLSIDEHETANANDQNGRDYRSPLEAGGFEAFPQDFRKSRLPLVAGGLVAVLVVVGLAAVVYSQRDFFLEDSAPETNVAAVQPAPAQKPEPVAKRPSRVESPSQGKSSERLPQAGGSVRTVPTQRVTAPSGAENGALNTNDDGSANTTIVPTAPDSRSTGSNANADQSSGAGTEPTGTEVARVEPTTPAVSQGAAPGAVAQTAILYEEGSAGTGGAAGEKANGQVVWKKEQDGAVSSVVADVSIPDKASNVRISVKPNTEDGFPASHLVEMQFSGPLGSAIRTVPGLIMKSTEQAQGDALVGAAIKVTDGLFWIALSAEDKDLVRNRSLLETRGWIDIPLLYASGKRAILTIEKGVPGEQAVGSAFKEWARN